MEFGDLAIEDGFAVPVWGRGVAAII
jgi:hypothetical protein